MRPDNTPHQFYGYMISSDTLSHETAIRGRVSQELILICAEIGNYCLYAKAKLVRGYFYKLPFIPAAQLRGILASKNKKRNR
ncbi:MAG: hypothetical protein AAB686_01100, partial [Patescibacteria group bacterium]